MPLSSPMTITIGAQAYSLTKKNQDNFGSTWMDNTTVPGTEVKIKVSHSYEGKPKNVASGSGFVQSQIERHIIDLTVTVTDENGFQRVTQTYTHIRNLRGSTVGAVGDVAQALAVYVNANADALVAWDN
jgi:cysteine synthase